MAFFRKTSSRSYEILSNFDHYTPDWKGLGVVVLFLLAGYLIASIVGAVVMIAAGQDFFMTYGQTIVYPLMFIPAMIYCSHKSTSNELFDGASNPMDTNGFAPLGGLMCALLVSVLTLALAFVLDPLNEVLPEVSDRIRMALEAMMKGPLWLALLNTAIFAPIFEEWLCRGTVLRGLLKKVKPVWAIIISAAFFGLIHGNIWQAIPAFFIGCALGWVYYKTGSLKLTMLMHCVNNTFCVIMSRIPGIEATDSFREAFADAAPYWITYAAAVILLVLCVLRLNTVTKTSGTTQPEQ